MTVQELIYMLSNLDDQTAEVRIVNNQRSPIESNVLGVTTRGGIEACRFEEYDEGDGETSEPDTVYIAVGRDVGYCEHEVVLEAAEKLYGMTVRL